jgi:hypothetical protein
VEARARPTPTGGRISMHPSFKQPQLNTVTEQPSQHTTMAHAVEQSPYFTDRRADGGLVVSDAPKFDLESYAANYDRMF